MQALFQGSDYVKFTSDAWAKASHIAKTSQCRQTPLPNGAETWNFTGKKGKQLILYTCLLNNYLTVIPADILVNSHVTLFLILITVISVLGVNALTRTSRLDSWTLCAVLIIFILLCFSLVYLVAPHGIFAAACEIFVAACGIF